MANALRCDRYTTTAACNDSSVAPNACGAYNCCFICNNRTCCNRVELDARKSLVYVRLMEHEMMRHISRVVMSQRNVDDSCTPSRIRSSCSIFNTSVSRQRVEGVELLAANAQLSAAGHPKISHNRAFDRLPALLGGAPCTSDDHKRCNTTVTSALIEQSMKGCRTPCSSNNRAL